MWLLHSSSEITSSPYSEMRNHILIVYIIILFLYWIVGSTYFGRRLLLRQLVPSVPRYCPPPPRCSNPHWTIDTCQGIGSRIPSLYPCILWYLRPYCFLYAHAQYCSSCMRLIGQHLCVNHHETFLKCGVEEGEACGVDVGVCRCAGGWYGWRLRVWGGEEAVIGWDRDDGDDVSIWEEEYWKSDIMISEFANDISEFGPVKST